MLRAVDTGGAKKAASLHVRDAFVFVFKICGVWGWEEGFLRIKSLLTKKYEVLRITQSIDES